MEEKLKKEMLRIGSLVSGRPTIKGGVLQQEQLAIVLRLCSKLYEDSERGKVIDVYWLDSKIADWEYPSYLKLVKW